MAKENKLVEKYPSLKPQLDLIELAEKKLNDYFATIIKNENFSAQGLFCMSLVNRTNQCIMASEYCLMEDLPLPLTNIVRQMIEIFATCNYIITSPEKFNNALFGSKGNKDPDLKLPNVIGLIRNLKEVDPIIVDVYDEYCEISHPNSRSVFSSFNPSPSKEFNFSMHSHKREINPKTAFHIVRNIGSIANMIADSCKKINPYTSYIDFEDFKKEKIKKLDLNFETDREKP